MKKKMKRIPVLERLAKEMKVLSAEEQRMFLGGGTGAQNDPYMQYEYYALRSVGSWSGGYVEGWDYVDANGFWGGSSGSSGNYGVNDNNGSSGNSGSGGYFDYGSGGDYGSGSGNGFGSGDVEFRREPRFSSYNQFMWDSIKDGLLNNALSDYNINLNDLTIIGTNNGGANAWILEQWGQKVICLENGFFQKDDKGKLRVLFEEYFHVKGDKPLENKEPIKTTTLTDPPTLPAELPDYVKRHLWNLPTNHFHEGDEGVFQRWLTDESRSINIIYEPNYYENEVNANTKVRNLMYNQLSQEGKDEIDYRIWYYGEMAKIAEKYHH